MPRIEFRMDPAWVSVSEGLSLAFRHWRATATWWAIPVLVVGIISTLAYWGLEATLRASATPAEELFDPYTGAIDMGALLAPMIPQFVVSTLILGTIALIARWVYYALAIKGLRGGEVTSGWLIARGLRALVVDLLILLAASGLVGAVFLLGMTAGTGLALIVGAVALLVLFYVEVRLIFWPLAIFDGAGIGEALSGSWRASEGAVLRMIGWALAAAGVGILVNIGAAIVTLPIADALPLQSGVKAGVTEAFAVFTLFALAVLYESQLRRNLPERASPPPAGYAEPVRAWPGYAPVDPRAAVPSWPSGPGGSTAPGGASAPTGGFAPAWDEPPVNPDAPDAWDPKPADPRATGASDASDAPPPPPPPGG